MKKPSILVLAAGPLQMPLIQAAKRKHLRIVAVDADPAAPGLQIADAAHVIALDDHDANLEVAERGTQYLRDHMRFVDTDNDIVYWYHGIKVEGDYEKKLFTSEFDDDYDAVPMYEQIYALAGPTQTFRVTGDRRIAADIHHTMRLFENHFLQLHVGRT